MSRARILVFNAGSRRILFADRVKSGARKNERDRIGINLNPTPESQASAYVMGRTSEEYERLRRQAELLEPITASVFGGRIVVQDYYFPSIDSYPSVEPLDEFKKVFFGVYTHTRRETRMGLKLPGYFIEAGIGTPDGTDVSGHLLPMQVGARMLAAVYRSVLPLALKYGVTTEQRSASFFEEIRKSESDSSYFLWPLLVSAWRQKPA
jgi:hypothetical protein